MLRRDIGILGFIHKRILEKCHPLLFELMPRRNADRFDYHNKPIDISMDQNLKFRSLFDRSLFGRILLYNRLTQSLVDEESICNFQRRLTAIAKARCLQDDPHWDHTFHSIEYLQPHLLAHV